MSSDRVIKKVRKEIKEFKMKERAMIMNYKGLKVEVHVTGESLWTTKKCMYKQSDIVQELDELIFCDEEMTVGEAIEKGILTEKRS